MRVWNLDAAKVQLRIFSHLREEDFSWDFVLDRDAFIGERHDACNSLGALGGWGAAWGDMAIEDGYREKIQIDTDGKIVIDDGRPAIDYSNRKSDK